MAATEIRSNTVKSVSVGLARNPNTIPSRRCGGRTSADSVAGASGGGAGEKRHRGQPATQAFYERRGDATVQKEIDAAEHVVRLH